MKIIKPVSEYADRYQVGPMVGVTKVVSGIKGAMAILHGVDGCTFAANQSHIIFCDFIKPNDGLAAWMHNAPLVEFDDIL